MVYSNDTSAEHQMMSATMLRCTAGHHVPSTSFERHTSANSHDDETIGCFGLGAASGSARKKSLRDELSCMLVVLLSWLLDCSPKWGH